ncbi:MAG: hypothetical protein GX442_15090 [Candidatus Riflebacteria bacterium]|nr:hypothetical protein [Candidatus Riflebacteria bacterium]
MTAAIGLDLGSRRTKAILWQDGRVADREVFQAWAFDRARIERWVAERRPAAGRLGATGYARQAAVTHLQATAITEIRAFGRGAVLLTGGQTPSESTHPGSAASLPASGQVEPAGERPSPAGLTPSVVRTLVDIGGQDAKAIALGPAGQVTAFEMNDRCAAGTGKFFELLAATLGVEFAALSPLALQAPEAATVTSTCAVFAESEIVGRLAEGASPGALARGVFRAVAERLAAMLRRTGFAEPAFLVGGGANECLAAELGAILGLPFRLHPDGAFLGAVGAAWQAGAHP